MLSIIIIFYIIWLHINFDMSELYLTWHFCFLGLCWDTVAMSVSLPSVKLLKIQHLGHCLFQTWPFTVLSGHVFLVKTNFCANGHSSLIVSLSFRVTCLMYIIL